MDYRTEISKTKHYINIPMPIFKHLCSIDLTIAQEHVFMLHWFEGQMNGDWKSKLSISVVSERLCLSVATVKRAYSALASHGLIKRHDQGRCLTDPSKKAVSVTEVTLPEDIIESMLSEPNRAEANTAMANSALSNLNEFQETCTYLEYEEFSANEISNKEQETSSPEATAAVENTKKQPAPNKNNVGYKPPKSHPLLCAEIFGDEANRVSFLFAGKIREEIERTQCASSKDIHGLWNEVIWTIKSGPLSKFNVVKAKNIALKMVRRNAWKKPSGMPQDWNFSSLAHS